MPWEQRGPCGDETKTNQVNVVGSAVAAGARTIGVEVLVGVDEEQGRTAIGISDAIDEDIAPFVL